MRSRTLRAMFAVAVIVAACGSGEDSADTTTSSVPSATATTTTTAAPQTTTTGAPQTTTTGAPQTTTTTTAAPEATAERFEWRQVIDDGTVALFGDKPDGVPTETWLDDELVDRDEEGSFVWDEGTGLPLVVAIIDGYALEGDCDQLENEIDTWLEEAAEDDALDRKLRHLAWAQYAEDQFQTAGCG